MNDDLSKILKLTSNLTKQKLMLLNQAIVALIKTKQDVDFKIAAISFNKGDIVSFIDSSGVRINGVVTRKNLKTLQITTPDNYYVNIPATYVKLEKTPSKNLVEFRRKIAPTHEEMSEIPAIEIKKDSFH
jgi:hypothetical protein